MKHNPLVTVIIPTYNRADKIGTAIKSVMNQTYKNIQLIIIDDGSTDTTKDVVNQYPGVNYFVQRHAGQASARNNGLQRADGSLIASLDSDDTWHANFLSHCVAKLERENLDFVFANWIQQARDNTTRDYLRTYPLLAPYIAGIRNCWVNLDTNALKNLYLKGCPSPSSSAVIRKSSIVSGWNNEIHIGDDWCLFLDMILHKDCQAAFCMEQLWTKNVNDLNIYDGRAWNEIMDLLYVRDLKKMLACYSDVLEENEFDELETLHLKGMLSLAIYHLFQKGNIRLSTKFMKDSFVLNAGRTFKIFPQTLKACLDRKMNTVQFPFNESVKLSTD